MTMYAECDYCDTKQELDAPEYPPNWLLLDAPASVFDDQVDETARWVLGFCSAHCLVSALGDEEEELPEPVRIAPKVRDNKKVPPEFAASVDAVTKRD